MPVLVLGELVCEMIGYVVEGDDVMLLYQDGATETSHILLDHDIHRSCHSLKHHYITMPSTHPQSFALHVLQQVSEPSPSLLSRRQDLCRGQHEAAVTGITELNSHREISLDIFGRIINRGTGDLVDGAADGALCKGRAVHSFDGGNGAPGEA
jgi:hypothetical protein